MKTEKPYGISYKPNKSVKQTIKTLRFKNEGLTNNKIIDSCIEYAMSNNIIKKMKWDI